MVNEVHLEFVCRDEVYEALKRWLPRNPEARLMLLIDSCPHCNHYLFPCGIEKTRRRYKELIECAPIGLHTHLFYQRHWWVSTLTYEQQYELLQNGVKFIESCGGETSHFAPGNWQFNKDTIMACHELGLTNFHWHEHERNKNVVAWAKKNLKKFRFISTVKNYTHDWTIHKTTGV